jgi:hypothetical protein
MPLTIDITYELESRIRQRAAQQGLDVTEYVSRTLQEHLRGAEISESRHLSAEESRLLQEINVGLPGDTWQRYRELIQKRGRETLTASEQAELISISDQIEELDARRAERLVELARTRNTSLAALVEELGIKARPYG